MKKTKILIAAAACTCLLGAMPVLAAGSEDTARQLLEDVAGTYEELFTVICDPQYDQLWLDDCAAVTGEEMAQMYAEILKSACTGTIYGEEASEAYADTPDEAQFDCFFINGVKQFVFDGNHISGFDENGEEVFGCDYKYSQDLSLGGMMDGYLYETDAEDAGEFRYFLLFPDTPESTYHIEFRYGSDIDALSQYNEGPYAYWLAGGIPADCGQEMIENVIGLFVEENLAEMEEEDNGEALTEGESDAEQVSETVEIGTAQQLSALAASVLDGSMNGYAGMTVVLTDDIDCSGIEWQPIGTMDLADMSNYSCMFQGTFDGQGHTISNVTFDTEEPFCGAGVIGMNVGEVKNLNVENVQVHCTNDYSMAIGGVVGYNMGVVHDVTLGGENEIAGVNCTGGICGGSLGSVYNCSVEGTTICVLGDNEFPEGRIVQCDVAECGGLVIGGSFGGMIDNCTAQGKVTAKGNEPVGLGGIAGCLEMMDTVTNCTAEVEIVTAQGGHAIGGLCGFSGTHSNGNIVADTEGIITTEYPGIIENCHVTVKMDIPGATHTGGLVGTGLYYYGEETAFRISNCSADGEITGAVTPGAVAGRAENSVIESCETDITLDGAALEDQVGQTAVMYESGDQFEEETEEDPAA